MVDERAIGERYRLLNAQGVLDERTRRLWAAAEARAAGYGGLAAVVRATGISESTVLRGLADLDSEERPAPGNVRRHPGRTPILEREPGLAEDLERLVDPVTRGDPESPLRWTSKSGAKLAEALREMGHDVVERTVLRLLKAKGYSLQANKKTREGSQHPDRDAQFQHISETVSEALAAGEPVISVDAKKRELVGDFKAVGREFEPKGRPVEVRGHDFKDKRLGHAIPYGVYDLATDEGWVSVGITRECRRNRVSVAEGQAMPTRTHSRIDQEDVVSEERSDPGSAERREVFAGLPGGPGLDEEPLEVSDELLDALLSGARTAEEIAGPDGLLGQLTRRLLNRALEAELTEHLGYEAGEAPPGGAGNARNGKPGKTILTDQGPLRIRSPRDRTGTFEPQIVRKRQTRWVGFDDRVISLYARGRRSARFRGTWPRSTAPRSRRT